MANTLNQLKKMRSQNMVRGENVMAALLEGIPESNAEKAFVGAGVAAAVTAFELISPVPTTVLGVIGEAASMLAGAFITRSAVAGRHYWKAAFLGTDADVILKEALDKAEKEDEADAALDSNLKPVRTRVTPWTRTSEQTDEFLRQHGTDQIRLVK